MKFRAQAALLAALACAGCASLSDATSGVRGMISPRETTQVRSYAANARATYDAVRVAAAEMGYRFVRGGPAQGEFEAISALGRGETLGSARQLAMKVSLHTALDGASTDVTIRLTEILEADSSNRAGQATQTPLRDTPQYDVFFRKVGRVLGVEPSSGRTNGPG